MNFSPSCANGTENEDIRMKLIMLTYPNEYGNVLTPHPEIIYDIVPPIAVNEMKTDEIPIDLINENPKIIVRIRIRNMPPPIPSKPDRKPTIIPVNVMDNGLN